MAYTMVIHIDHQRTLVLLKSIYRKNGSVMGKGKSIDEQMIPFPSRKRGVMALSGAVVQRPGETATPSARVADRCRGATKNKASESRHEPKDAEHIIVYDSNMSIFLYTIIYIMDS